MGKWIHIRYIYSRVTTAYEVTHSSSWSAAERRRDIEHLSSHQLKAMGVVSQMYQNQLVDRLKGSDP